MTARTRALAWIATLTVAWVLLQGDLTVANLLGGLAVGTLVVVAVPLAPPERHHVLHPLAALRFLGFVLWSLVTSSATVAWTVLRPTDARLRSGIVRCELPGASPLVATLVANAITVTPGTITLTVDCHASGATLHVHALGLSSPEELRDEVADLQRRATAACTPRPEALAGEALR